MRFPGGDLGRALARLVWPARCAGCSALVDEAEVFCKACGVTVLPVAQACPGCAMPDVPAGALVRCGGCRARPLPFAAARAAVLYGGAAADAVLRFKHAGRRDLGPRLGRLLAPSLRRALDDGVDVAMAVPLHPRRLRARGFNQALDLLLAARAAAGASGLGVERDTLRRVRDTAELGHAGPAARRRAVTGAFALSPRAQVRGRRVLVVDDVLTTGATMGACAQTLVDAGAASVAVLAFARAP